MQGYAQGSTHCFDETCRSQSAPVSHWVFVSISLQQLSTDIGVVCTWAWSEPSCGQPRAQLDTNPAGGLSADRRLEAIDAELHAYACLACWGDHGLMSDGNMGQDGTRLCHHSHAVCVCGAATFCSEKPPDKLLSECALMDRPWLRLTSHAWCSSCQ